MTTETKKIALVTGASRGLGYAIALEIAKNNYHVIAVARTNGGLEDLDDEIQTAGGSATLVPMDLTNDESIAHLGRAIYDRWGRLDVLVNCAAQNVPLAPASHLIAKDFDTLMNINTRVVHQLIRCCDPLLKLADKSDAIFITDNKHDTKFWGAYGASKLAAETFIKSYAAEITNPDHIVGLYQPPEMATELRSKAYPGQTATSFTPENNVAKKLVDAIVNKRFTHGKCINF